MAMRCKLIKLLFFSLIAFVLLVGCSRRSITKSRSEIISESKSKGVKVRSIDEDKKLFYADQEKNKERLIALVRSRASGEFRDKNYKVGPGDEIELV